MSRPVFYLPPAANHPIDFKGETCLRRESIKNHGNDGKLFIDMLQNNNKSKLIRIFHANI